MTQKEMIATAIEKVRQDLYNQMVRQETMILTVEAKDKSLLPADWKKRDKNGKEKWLEQALGELTRGLTGIKRDLKFLAKYEKSLK